MAFSFRKFSRRNVSLLALACMAASLSIPDVAWSEETETSESVASDSVKSDSTTKSTNSNASQRQESSRGSGQGKEVEEAIAKIEQQLRDSNLPKDLQRKTLEALRSGLEKGQDRVRVEVRSQKSGPNATHWNVQSSGGAALNPASGIPVFVRSRILESIEQAIDDEKLEPEVAARLMERIRDSLSKASIPLGLSSRSNESKFMIGISLDAQKEDSDREGFRVNAVFDDSPASKAGITTGDRILSVDGKLLGSVKELTDATQAAGKAGRRLELVVLSEGKEKTLSIEPAPASKLAEFEFPYVTQAWTFDGKDWNNGQPLFRGHKGFSFEFSPEMAEELSKSARQAAEAAKAWQQRMKEIREQDSQRSASRSDQDDDEDLASTRIEKLEKELLEIKEMLQQLLKK